MSKELQTPVDITADFVDQTFLAYVCWVFIRRGVDNNIVPVYNTDVSNIKKLYLDGRYNGIIKDISGIEHFVNLEELDCGGNELVTVDVSKNQKLRRLYCDNNQLAEIDISKNPLLEVFYCNDNQLTAIHTSTNTKLEEFDCSGNQLTAIDVSTNHKLRYFYCNRNQLTAIDVSKNLKLEKFGCAGNPLTSVDTSNNAILKRFYCENDSEKASVPEEPSVDDCWQDHTLRLITDKREFQGSCYIEFLQGKHKEKYWSDNSAFVHDDAMDTFYDLITKANESFDPNDNTFFNNSQIDLFECLLQKRIVQIENYDNDKIFKWDYLNDYIKQKHGRDRIIKMLSDLIIWMRLNKECGMTVIGI